jgi:transposase InsO family protein
MARTMDLITRNNYRFNKMREQINEYIQGCPSCQVNKAENHAKYGELQKLPLPEFPWASLTMDFITKLPPSKDPVEGIEYDSIMVVVDRHTKYTTMIPFKETYDAVRLGYIFLDRIVRYRGFPKEVTSDRDKLFTSNYWKTLLQESGVKAKLSTAYHPQTDGQTERANRTLKTYLRHYVHHNQNNWVTLLPMAELSCNNLISEATGTTPFYANYGRQPNMMDSPRPSPKSEKALQTVQDLKQLHAAITEQVEWAQLRMEKQANKTRTKGPQLKEGDKVYLHTKNLKTKRPSKKLDHVRVGPFEIDKVVGPVNYRLRLPNDAKVHPVFHISLLEPADPRTPVATKFYYELEEENEFEVERILKCKGGQYLTKWKGYPDSENTWEPRDHLLPNCRKLLQRFHRQERTSQESRRTRSETSLPGRGSRTLRKR